MKTTAAAIRGRCSLTGSTESQPRLSPLTSSLATLLVLSAISFGCSFATKSTRPVPGEQRNLFCLIEYRPDPARPGAPDLLFLAAGNPYKTEEVALSLPDGLAHGLFAPGRHLSRAMEIEGATCEHPWQKGHRLPSYLRVSKGLLCRRTNAEKVRLAVETKYGQCSIEIDLGDRTPRCRTWLGRGGGPLERLSPDVCPEFPMPEKDSRRGRLPGIAWVTIEEGSGRTAERGSLLTVHQSVVDRYSYVASSTHFQGQPRLLRLAQPDLDPLLVPALEGTKVGERRRLYLVPPFDARVHPGDLRSDEILFYDFELVALDGQP